ncbi:hypothetical protein F4859DRAFT_472369 [Xylaria cf. heliscus]|nr:hypothetical protein F4859DRAFT_472369 [Xylaria cf. heliscus]
MSPIVNEWLCSLYTTLVRAGALPYLKQRPNTGITRRKRWISSSKISRNRTDKKGRSRPRCVKLLLITGGVLKSTRTQISVNKRWNLLDHTPRVSRSLKTNPGTRHHLMKGPS